MTEFQDNKQFYGFLMRNEKKSHYKIYFYRCFGNACLPS